MSQIVHDATHTADRTVLAYPHEPLELVDEAIGGVVFVIEYRRVLWLSRCHEHDERNAGR